MLDIISLYPSEEAVAHVFEINLSMRFSDVFQYTILCSTVAQVLVY